MLVKHIQATLYHKTSGKIWSKVVKTHMLKAETGHIGGNKVQVQELTGISLKSPAISLEKNWCQEIYHSGSKKGIAVKGFHNVENKEIT